MSKFLGTASGQFIAAVAIFIVFVTAIWTGSKTNFYRGAVPAGIELTWGIPTTASSMSIWEAFLPIRHEACGGAIFGLTSAAAADIQSRGVAALAQARQGRGYTEPADRRYTYYSYEPWHPTPLPDGWLSESLLGMWYGLACMNLSRSYGGAIAKAANSEGSFYTTRRESMLLVIPSMKLVVYTYSN